MRARALPPDAPARRHVSAVVLAIVCYCFALPSGRLQYVYEYVCVMGAWVCICECTCACVYVHASSDIPSPRLPLPRPSCPPLRSSLFCRILVSLRPACFLSPPLASPVPDYPLLIPPLPFSSIPSSPLPPLASHLLASPLLSPLPSPPCAGISAKYAPLQKLGPM